MEKSNNLVFNQSFVIEKNLTIYYIEFKLNLHQKTKVKEKLILSNIVT